MLLSSPLHPRTPKGRDNRARYAHTILHPETTPAAAEAVVSKLIEHLQLMEGREELLQVENNNLRLATAERRARKARKRQVLSTNSVLTSELIQAIVTKREAANQAKEEARLQREQNKKNREEAVALAKKQLEARKDALVASIAAKKLAEQHRKDAWAAALAAKREQRASEAAANVAKKKKRTIEAQKASIKAAATAAAAAAEASLKKAVAEASLATAAMASAYYKELLEALKKTEEQAT